MIKTIKHHECWHFNPDLTIFMGYDIMLLETDIETPFSQPIRLASESQLSSLPNVYPSGENFVSYGFGRTSTNSNQQVQILQKTDPVEYIRCDLLALFTDRDDMMCYTVKNQQTICNGDSGGPRVQGKVQYGVHSSTLNSGSVVVCEQNTNLAKITFPGHPNNGQYLLQSGSMSLDTAVGDYITWIRGNSDYDPAGVFFGDEITTTVWGILSFLYF